MGVLTNITVYGLMIAPTALMLRGHNIALSRHILLAVVIAALQLVFSLLLGCVTHMPLLILLTSAVVIPVIRTTFLRFLLSNNKAARIFHLDRYTDDDDAEERGGAGGRSHSSGGEEKNDATHQQEGSAAAALSTIYVLIDIILFRWFPWYRALSSHGFVYDNVASAVECFLLLITLLAACRMLRRSHEYVRVIIAVHAVAAMLAELPMLRAHAHLATAVMSAVGITAMRALTRQRLSVTRKADATGLKKSA